MGIPILILGESGSGKSSSLRNFDIGELLVLNVAGKLLPFRKKLERLDNARYSTIGKALQEKKYKRYVIDDSQYLLAFELFNKVKESGYGKFTDMAVRFYNMIQFIISSTPEDCIVYLFHHIQNTEHGIKAKTIGKMLDDQLTVEGLFSVVLMAEYDNGRYCFRTSTNGNDTVKSPMGMFGEKQIDNDLKLVDQAIRSYWELGV